MSKPVAESSIIAQILARRGIEDALESSFLHPDFQRDLHPPNELRDMKKAVTRLAQAIAGKERILIFGDYDADGVPATALLVRVLRSLGAEPSAIIPKRSEGYGLTPAAVQAIIALAPNLVITLDNGTVAKDEVALLAQAGVETIICDHHEPLADELAVAAVAIINPKQPGCPYPFKELCGCALVWKVCWALLEYLQLPPERLKWQLDLVALSTVADMVPLLGENRVLVQFGLQVLQRTRNTGLQALAVAADLQLSTCDEVDIGFRIAPRLNAPSRMHQELVDGKNAALELLITEDPNLAKRLAAHLQQCNSARQLLVEQHLDSAKQQAAEQSERLALVLFDPTWSSGIIGLVASRMLELYQRPVVVLAPEAGQLKGSVRSVDQVHVLELLTATRSELERFGGHAKAGGLTINSTELAAVARFQDQLDTWLKAQSVSLADFANSTDSAIDLTLDLATITLELAEEIKSLAPFGVGFRQPLFESVVQVAAVRRVGREGQHLSCRLVQGSYSLKAIGFGMGEQIIEPEVAYRAQYQIQIEEWQGRQTVSCRLIRLVLV